MADMFSILKIAVGAKKLTARVLVNHGMCLRTSEDIEATARVYYLAPAIATHACLGDAGEHFQDCMSDTFTAHLLEHLTVEIMNQTGLAGDVVSGRTRQVPEDERLFDIELSCPDDALTVGALSSATFMMQWAFLHAEQPAPDFAGTVAGLRHLVLGLRGALEQGAQPTASAAGGIDADAEGEPAGQVGGEAGQAEVALDVEGAAATEHEVPADAVFGGAAGE